VDPNRGRLTETVQLDDGGLDLPDFPSGLPLDTTLAASA
jgi:hypothetical protein